jgi:hypothetical protein
MHIGRATHTIVSDILLKEETLVLVDESVELVCDSLKNIFYTI